MEAFVQESVVRTFPPITREMESPEKPEAESAVIQFIRSVEQAEFKNLILLLPQRLIQKVCVERLEEIFTSNAVEVWERGGVQGLDVRPMETDQSHAAFDVRILYGDGSVDHERIDVLVEQGSWKIDLERR